ncbi:uncharacterized protein METZ01_LOCUS258396 [marine metagenome]|uniref:Uncharacterized protein n=1 Tax=marine metagenome TaxID=408172 RepID=A0A382J294_9ZZZZ
MINPELYKNFLKLLLPLTKTGYYVYHNIFVRTSLNDTF